MICALLIFRTPDLPAPLWRLSPWLDTPDVPPEHVDAQLTAQRHRRFIKTHTPLAGIPSDTRVTYVVTARNPLDAFVSMYHQDRLIGPPPAGRPVLPRPPRRPRNPAVSRQQLHEALLKWIGGDTPRRYSPSLHAVIRHLSEAWMRRSDPNVVLLHYDDLLSDLEAQMRRLATELGIAVEEQSWPTLVEAATFERMRDRNDVLVPPPPGIVPDNALFFGRGTSGAAREILDDEEMARYRAQAARIAPPGLLEWLHRSV
jgi:aryl sulfotransferase